jgi:DNA-binding response OmpR family regulator
MRILSLSLDQELAFLRRFALAAALHQVTSVTREKDIIAECKDNAAYDIILICHTLPGALARQLVRFLRQSKPQAQVVYIAHKYGEWPDVEAERYVVGDDGPEALVRLLNEIKDSSDQKQLP